MSDLLNFETEKLGSMEVYDVRIQKVVGDMTDPYTASTVAYVDHKVNELQNILLGGAGAAFDTLKEIETFFKSADENIAASIVSQISSETDERKAQDALNNSNLSAEISRAQSAENALSGRIDSEVSTRSTVTTVLAERLNALDKHVILGDPAAGDLGLLERMDDAETLNSDLYGQIYGTVNEGVETPGLNTKLAMVNSRIDDLKTDSIQEGTNQYFTADRAKAAVEDDYKALIQAEKDERIGMDATKAGLGSVNAFTAVNTFQAGLNATDVIVGNELRLNLDSSVDRYLYFSTNWRMSGNPEGTRLVFEHRKNGVWKQAIPFIVA